MSGIRQEKETFGQIFERAVCLASERGEISEKLLKKKLGIALPTAVKVMAAMYACGFIGAEGKRGVFEFSADRNRLMRLGKNDGSTYEMLVEEDGAYKCVTFIDYACDTLLQALNFALNFGGSMSVGFLQRKLNVGLERATEIYDIIYACGFLGEDDEFNPGRKKLNITHSDYDALYARIHGGRR